MINSSMKILLVDDDPAILEILADLMAIFGNEYETAQNGIEALEKLKQDLYHIVLTDMMMPEGVSGRELADRVLQDRSDLKVIYSSGYSLDSIGNDSLATDGANFLQKPYDPETLASMVRSCLNN